MTMPGKSVTSETKTVGGACAATDPVIDCSAFGFGTRTGVCYRLLISDRDRTYYYHLLPPKTLYQDYKSMVIVVHTASASHQATHRSIRRPSSHCPLDSDSKTPYQLRASHSFRFKGLIASELEIDSGEPLTAALR